MLKFFRHNYPIQIAVILLAAVTVWIPAFFEIPDVLPQSNGTAPLYDFLVEVFDFAPWVVTAITFSAFIFSVFFFNSMLIANQMSAKNSVIGSLMFILCLASSTLSFESYQFIIASPFIMVAMQTMYSLMQTETPESYLFNVGVFIGLSSMFYYPSIILIVWMLIVMLIYGYKQLRLYFIPFVGLLLPYFFMFVIAYFKRDLFNIASQYSSGFLGIKVHDFDYLIKDMLVIATDFMLFIISYLKIITSNFANSIHVRNRINITLLLLVFSILMMIIQLTSIRNGLFFTVLAVFYTMALSSVGKSKIAEMTLLFYIIYVLTIQYMPMFL